MSTTERRRTDSDWALIGWSPWSGSVRRCVADVQHGDHPVQQAVGDLALGQQRQVVARAVGRRGSRRGWCRCRSRSRAPRRRWRRAGRRPCGGACRAPGRASPVSAAKPTMTGRGSSTPGTRADLGEDVLGGLELEGHALAARELGVRGVPRAEVGDRRGHDEDVGGVVDHGVEHRRAHRRRRLGADDRGRGRAARTSTRPATMVTRAPRARAASAIATPILPGAPVADEPHGVDRLRGAAGADDDVAPLEVRLHPRRRLGRALRGVGLADGPALEHRDDGVHDERQVGEPPDPALPRRERPDLRRDDARTRSRARGARRCRASPGGSTCRRPSPARPRPARAVARQAAVTASLAIPFAIAPSQRAVAGATTRTSAAVGDHDVADPPVGEQAEDVGLDGVARERVEGERAHELLRGRRQHHDDVGALGAQEAQQLDGLVRRDRAADAEADEPALERARSPGARPRARRRRPRRTGSRGPCSVRSGSMTSTPSTSRAHGSIERPPVRIPRTPSRLVPESSASSAADAREEPGHRRLVAEDRAALHRAHGVPADRPAGVRSSIRGSRAVLAASASRPSFMPGAIAPPRNAPSAPTQS